VAPQLRNWR